MVSASGATIGLRPLNEPRTAPSMNSTIHSTKFCSPQEHRCWQKLRGQTEEKQEQDAEPEGEPEGIEVHRPETHLFGLLGGLGNPPTAVRQPPKRQVLKVVLDVLRGSQGIARHGLASSSSLNRIKLRLTNHSAAARVREKPELREAERHYQRQGRDNFNAPSPSASSATTAA